MRRIASIALLGLLAGCNPAKKAAPEPPPPAAVEDKPEAPPKLPPADAVLSASGLASKIEKRGHGDQRARPHDKVRVLFTAWNEKGKLTDSSDKRGGPVVFDVTGVIKGWSEALQEMQLGEKRRIWVPDDLSYPGRPGYPRGNSVFDIELLEIIPGVPEPAVPPDVAKAPDDATTTKSGLAYKLLARGESQDKPAAWDRVTLRVAGWTAEGKALEHLPPHDEPSRFDLDAVPPGWREALLLLSIGDRARIWLPEALAYQGRAGMPAGPLVFELELISIERKPEPPRAPASVARAPGNATRTKSGLAYRIVQRGGGTSKPALSDRVEVSYSAWTSDGALFDSSVVRGKPATLPLSRIIPGWAEGLQLMAEGDKALMWIPEKLAYAGKQGSPKGPLLYEVELRRIVR